MPTPTVLKHRKHLRHQKRMHRHLLALNWPEFKSRLGEALTLSAQMNLNPFPIDTQQQVRNLARLSWLLGQCAEAIGLGGWEPQDKGKRK